MLLRLFVEKIRFASASYCAVVLKTQIIADATTQEIICTAQEKGAVHDFNLFKATVRGIILGIALLADSGYQGLLGLAYKQLYSVQEEQTPSVVAGAEMV